LPALDVSGLIPLTPGNVGIASAAIAIAFRAHGVSFDRGLAAGITLQALETAVGLSIGIASVLWLAPYRSPGLRRAALLSAAGAALGIKLLAVATVALASLAFAVILWREWGPTTRWSSRSFAVVWAGIVLSAAFPFALGIALALLALWALQAEARWRFALLAAL